jgi:predicted nuclease of restriction endonuclease-like RecB superfamily
MKINKKLCVICGQELSLYSSLYRPNAKYCVKHRNQYIADNFVKNKPKSLETKNKLREKALQRKPTRSGAILNNKTKDKISASLKTYFENNPDKIRKGEDCHFFGKVGTHGKHLKYGGVWMKSGWEEAFAKWCDKNKIKWEYELKTFDLGKTTYTPDFYVPIYDAYIEIKGWWRTDAKIKFDLFKQIYPDTEIVVLSKKELVKLGVL